MVNKNLQEARQQWFSEAIQSLEIDNIQADIVAKTGYKKQTVNTYVNNHRAISLDFMRTFCEAYGYDFEAVNHSIIERIKSGLVNSSSKKRQTASQVIENQDDVHTLDGDNTKSGDAPVLDAESKNAPLNEHDMNERLLRMLEMSLANEQRTTQALDRMTRTTEKLSDLLTNLGGKSDVDYPKGQTG